MYEPANSIDRPKIEEIILRMGDTLVAPCLQSLACK